MKKYCVHVSPQTFQPFSRASGDRLDRLLARDVDDVERGTGDARELDRAVRRLALGLGRARERVPVRLGVPVGERALDEHVDRVAVLGVHHHERAGRARRPPSS